MATKENYQDAIMRMYDFCISSNHPAQIREQFTQDLDFLAKLAEEHFEEKVETNLEHYFDELLKTGGRYAFVNGKIKHCWGTRCCDCAFKGGNCHGEKIKWLASPYEKPIYKLTQFEYDLLNAYKNSGMRQSISNYGTLLELYKKGYFKDIGTSIPIHEILDNYEVIQ